MMADSEDQVDDGGLAQAVNEEVLAALAPATVAAAAALGSSIAPATAGTDPTPPPA